MRVVCFDTVSTGIVSNRTMNIGDQPEMVEFCARIADLSTGATELEYDTLLRPKVHPIPRYLPNLCGITDQMLIAAPSFKECAPRIRGILTAADVIVGHSLLFDMEIVEMEFERIDEKIEWPSARICTVEQTIHITGKRLRLIDLYEFLFAEWLDGTHRAKTDVQVALRCAVELFRRDMI
jgi:DNA polymerase III epsilon subunit-like protein